MCCWGTGGIRPVICWKTCWSSRFGRTQKNKGIKANFSFADASPVSQKQTALCNARRMDTSSSDYFKANDPKEAEGGNNRRKLSLYTRKKENEKGRRWSRIISLASIGSVPSLFISLWCPVLHWLRQFHPAAELYSVALALPASHFNTVMCTYK